MKFEDLHSLDEKYGAPFYLMDSEAFEHNITALRSAFLKVYDKLIIGYSFKTNYVPAISGIAAHVGCYAEVVSGMEYEMAIHLGYDPGRIIFNGPIKRSEDIERAMELGSVINLDAEYELETVLAFKKRHPRKTLQIGLRVHMDLTDNFGISHVQNGLRFGRFGFSCRLLETVIPRLRAAGIEVCSLHGHTSSSDRSPENYKVISRTLLKVAEDFHLNELKFFNVGGGFFGATAEGIDVSQKPTYEDYAKAIGGEVLNNEWFVNQKPTLVIEPGVSVVANVFSLVTKIYEKKRFKDKEFVVVDSSIFEVRPSMHHAFLPFDVIKKEERAGAIERVDVVGSTCMEKDVILKEVEITGCQHGDYICIHGVGAYTLVFTPDFINYAPPIIEVGSHRLIRKRKGLKEILTLYP